MSDEIWDALRTRTQMSAVSRIERGASEAGEVAVRSIQAFQMALDNKSQALPLSNALWRAKDDLKKWEDRSCD